MTLAAEPGSNTVVSARLLVLGTGGAFGSGRSMSAIARISPVFGLLTIAMPPFAPIFTIWSDRARSVSNCMAVSIVRTRSLPGCAGVRRCSPPAIVPPRGSCSSTSWPGVPVSVDSYCCSRPARPTLSMFTLPSTPRASSPDGLKRFDSSSRSTPVELQVGHLLRGRVVDLAGEVHEPLVRRRELAQQRVLVDAEHRSERGRLRLRVGHELRVGPHRVLRHRHGEVVAVAVEQRAPLRRQRHRAYPLRLTELHVAVAVEQLQLREATGDEHEQEHDDHQHGDDPPALVAWRRPPRAAGRRPPRAARRKTTAPSRDGSAGSRRDLATGRVEHTGHGVAHAEVGLDLGPAARPRPDRRPPARSCRRPRPSAPPPDAPRPRRPRRA